MPSQTPPPVAPRPTPLNWSKDLRNPANQSRSPGNPTALISSYSTTVVRPGEQKLRISNVASTSTQPPIILPKPSRQKGFSQTSPPASTSTKPPITLPKPPQTRRSSPADKANSCPLNAPQLSEEEQYETQKEAHFKAFDAHEKAWTQHSKKVTQHNKLLVSLEKRIALFDGAYDQYEQDQAKPHSNQRELEERHKLLEKEDDLITSFVEKYNKAGEELDKEGAQLQKERERLNAQGARLQQEGKRLHDLKYQSHVYENMQDNSGSVKSDYHGNEHRKNVSSTPLTPTQQSVEKYAPQPSIDDDKTRSSGLLQKIKDETPKQLTSQQGATAKKKEKKKTSRSRSSSTSSNEGPSFKNRLLNLFRKDKTTHSRSSSEGSKSSQEGASSKTRFFSLFKKDDSKKKIGSVKLTILK